MVHVRGNETEPLTVLLDARGWICGRIVDPIGRPVMGVMVCLKPEKPGVSRVQSTTDHEGRFRCAVIPGARYSLAVLSSRRLVHGVRHVVMEAGQCMNLGDLDLDD
jgi:hypothetical protein